MRKEELAAYRRELEARLATLTRNETTTVDELVENPQELPDPNDRATRETDLENAIRQREHEQKLVVQIRNAIARIDAGTFGRCASCGEEIAPERMRARPISVVCIDCQRESETERPR